MNRIYICLLAIAAALVAPCSGFASSETATVLSVVPGVVSKFGGQQTPLAPKTDVPIKATVQSDATGKAQLIFPDNAIVSVAPKTELFLEDFIDEPKKENMALKIVSGTARVVTGEVSRKNPDALKVKTPQATIGIRGTVVTINVANGNTSVYMTETSGLGITVRDNKSGRMMEMKTPGNMITVSPKGMEQRQVSPAEVKFSAANARGGTARPQKQSSSSSVSSAGNGSGGRNVASAPAIQAASAAAGPSAAGASSAANAAAMDNGKSSALLAYSEKAAAQVKTAQNQQKPMTPQIAPTIQSGTITAPVTQTPATKPVSKPMASLSPVVPDRPVTAPVTQVPAAKPDSKPIASLSPSVVPVVPDNPVSKPQIAPDVPSGAITAPVTQVPAAKPDSKPIASLSTGVVPVVPDNPVSKPQTPMSQPPAASVPAIALKPAQPVTTPAAPESPSVPSMPDDATAMPSAPVTPDNGSQNPAVQDPPVQTEHETATNPDSSLASGSESSGGATVPVPVVPDKEEAKKPISGDINTAGTANQGIGDKLLAMKYANSVKLEYGDKSFAGNMSLDIKAKTAQVSNFNLNLAGSLDGKNEIKYNIVDPGEHDMSLRTFHFIVDPQQVTKTINGKDAGISQSPIHSVRGKWWQNEKYVTGNIVSTQELFPDMPWHKPVGSHDYTLIKQPPLAK